jgi:hypothetical protein
MIEVYGSSRRIGGTILNAKTAFWSVLNGKKAVQKGTSRMGKLARMMLKELDDEDKQLCIQLLTSTEANFSVLLPKRKNKKFNDIYEENMG